MFQRWAVVGAVLALALVGGVLVGLRLAADNDTGGDPDREVETPRAAEAELVAPPGTRLVGAGGIVVAVPADWSTNEFRPCGLPARHTVIVEPTGPRRSNCTHDWPPPESLTIGDLEPPMNLVLGDVMHTPFHLAGVEAYRVAANVPTWPSASAPASPSTSSCRAGMSTSPCSAHAGTTWR